MVNINNLAYNSTTGMIGFRKKIAGVYDKNTKTIRFDYFMITLNAINKKDFILNDIKEEDVLKEVSEHMTMDEEKWKIWEMINP